MTAISFIINIKTEGVALFQLEQSNTFFN